MLGTRHLSSLASQKLRNLLLALAMGILFVLSMPPWGFWPLAFIAIAGFDQLLKGAQSTKTRFYIGFSFGLGWLFPGTFWMIALTVPGYFVQGLLFSGFYGLSTIAVPRTSHRFVALPAIFTLVEALRYRWPFGGVPLATIAMSQSNSPLGQTARILGPLFLTFLVITGGIALSLAWQRRWFHSLVLLLSITAIWIFSLVAPTGNPLETIDIAIVQGGGEQGTQAINTDEREVFERHLLASSEINGDPDLVLWPEDVVNVRQRFVDSPEFPELQELARNLNSWVVAGIFERISDTSNANASIVFGPDGEMYGRYDKVRLVPFGEYVPLRGLIEPFAPDYLPVRDTQPGSGEPNLLIPMKETEVNAGISISWEIFFEDRARQAVRNGGQILLNPTNGSSYWLRILQTQQVASSQLRAIENGRWVLQAAPTGFSAIVNPDGKVTQRTSISETNVLQGKVELRDGKTIATRAGPTPVIIGAILALGFANLMARRRN
ncbi:MAG: apolipoprotein N-acyltransferase [Acidimicrobiales bacterium]|nr:apolipoprotein N-acyltransferase [Acidimicrobiales bacterium]